MIQGFEIDWINQQLREAPFANQVSNGFSDKWQEDIRAGNFKYHGQLICSTSYFKQASLLYFAKEKIAFGALCRNRDRKHHFVQISLLKRAVCDIHLYINFGSLLIEKYLWAQRGFKGNTFFRLKLISVCSLILFLTV